ncbi:hypothetical protein G6O69_06060 [Pseudenhygromyxa sp. WMMC2535]|uniref:hypothetical protein n=1 Tax=Pseudenhygromyxa sp. WMMC2535 TaxID=2712867 RepID=UPI0015951352|nr:hypothetical protein [Pseudenhygromyxa sp. WMMC2535]NVB37388.1 hypothetical protein [Pseudenhygromyxa sp. WMMC2535]
MGHGALALTLGLLASPLDLARRDASVSEDTGALAYLAPAEDEPGPSEPQPGEGGGSSDPSQTKIDDPFASAGHSGSPSQVQPGQPDPQAQPGGFGTVETVEVDTELQRPPTAAPAPTPTADQLSPSQELSMRLEVGYGQVDLLNLQTLDHQGLSLRVNASYAWVSAPFNKAPDGPRVGIGVAVAYAYQGINRSLPQRYTFSRSHALQQRLGLGPEFVAHLHPQVSLRLAATIGAAFYRDTTDSGLLVAELRASLPEDQVFFALSGDLAVCTVWDMLCVTGGSELVSNARATTVEEGEYSVRVSPWGWHVGLAFDLLRALARTGSQPSR